MLAPFFFAAAACMLPCLFYAWFRFTSSRKTILKHHASDQHPHFLEKKFPEAHNRNIQSASIKIAWITAFCAFIFAFSIETPDSNTLSENPICTLQPEILHIQETVNLPQTERPLSQIPVANVPIPEVPISEIEIIDDSQFDEGNFNDQVFPNPELPDYGGFVSMDPPPAPPSSTPKIVRVPDIQPEYPGGLEGLYSDISKELRYPAEARSNTIEGTVYVEFVVNANGGIEKARIIRGIYSECDNEVLRVLNTLKKWKPASVNGKSVGTYYTLPVKFLLK